MRKAIAQGKTLEQVLASKPSADFDAQWGGSKFITPERFVSGLYRDLARKPGKAGIGKGSNAAAHPKTGH